MRLVVSWVSHHWRNVALGHRPLWNLVVNMQESLNLDYVRSCAELCQNLLVDLERPTSSLLDTCVANLSQATHLVLDLSSSTTTHSTIRTGHIWTQSAPLLGNMALYSVHIHYDATKGMDYPNLKSLLLIECNFRWKFVSALASTLSTLYIEEPRRPIAIPACILLLGSCPCLSWCTFDSCLTDNVGSVSAIPPRSGRLHLPQLKQLTLLDSMSHIIQLLRDIYIPHAHTSLKFNSIGTKSIDAVELFSALLDSQGPAQWGGEIRFLQVRSGFTIVNSGTSLKHRIHVPMSHPRFLQLPACQMLDFSALESLWTTSLSPEVLKVFSRLTRLRRVALETSDALKSFVTFMCTHAHDNASTMNFPALEELVLVSLDSGECLKELRDILASRKVWVTGLQKVVLFRCDNIGIGEVIKLKQVADVEFYGRRLEDLLI
ncbi:hypothetical protein BDN72DRAFT_897102 [Pluteus cervinus]|uniref:Uncharacterized protein n=1 Tax=Pluteus cervinus TaxID=181527 RepID=A0ACD3AW99_9AGAR|nr:hypothetical protein BDN72DRAFT_897102 [Pluteus cervinus]